MEQQTGVEWFAEMITEMIHEAYHSELADLFEQAKELEKQQREDDYKRGWEEATSIGVKESYKYQDRN
jgi:predicted transcriptional regulator